MNIKSNILVRSLIIIVFFIASTALASVNSIPINGNLIFYRHILNKGSKFQGTILFFNGSGAPMREWTSNKAFMHCIEKLGDIFLYDRSGLGNSPPDPSLSSQNPLTAKFVNFKLNKLLHILKVHPPYLIVAHSYGAMYAGYFARKNPKLIKGILFVDPVPLDYQWSEKLYVNHGITRNKVQELAKLSNKYLYKHYRLEDKMSAQLLYQLLGFDKTKEQISALPPLPNKIPVLILSSAYMQNNAPIKGSWFDLQKQWLNKNKLSQIIKIKSGHFIQIEHSRFVCDKIKMLLRASLQIISQGARNGYAI